MVKVLVKWGKERYEMDARTDDSPMQFKSQIFSLTGVKPDRQKVLVKGRVLGDSSWDGFELKDGTLMMMIGSGAELPTVPVPQPEDVAIVGNDQNATKVKLPLGLSNLGNTCYLNATIQCLKTVPELQDALKNYALSVKVSQPNANTEHGSRALTLAARDLYKAIDVLKANYYIPISMLRVLHLESPNFAERDEHGWMQQDANEFWTLLLRAFQIELKPHGMEESLVSKYMEGVFKVEMKNLESDSEPVTVSTEKFLQLSCYLSQETRYLHLGIKSKLIEQIVKNSEFLGRDAKYERKVLIDRLPAYLSIQMVRFFYKEKDKINAKILKDVKFPLTLDVYDMCTPELQKKFIPVRNEFKAEEDRKLEALRVAKTSESDAVEEKTKSNGGKSDEKVPFQYSFSDDLGSNNSGYYELKAVITHKGRSSSSGHYVAWVRMNEKQWAMCDDDEVHQVTSDEILALSGGGDWHCAYVLLYGPRLLKESTSA